MKSRSNSESGLLNAQGAADYLGVHLQSIREWVREGVLPQVRFGHRTVRFRRSDLDAFISSRVELRPERAEVNP